VVACYIHTRAASSRPPARRPAPDLHQPPCHSHPLYKLDHSDCQFAQIADSLSQFTWHSTARHKHQIRRSENLGAQKISRREI
jgi:hypothetical protein